MAAHTTAHNDDERDECYRGTREALRAGQAFLWCDFILYNQIADSMKELLKVIEAETWYGKWQEWWHNRDILTTDPKPINPYRLDLASHTWNQMVEDHIRGPPYAVAGPDSGFPDPGHMLAGYDSDQEESAPSQDSS